MSRFLPTVKTILPLDKIPSSLSLVRAAIENIVEGVSYKDYMITKSNEGDSTFVGISLVFYDEAAINIPGINDMKLVLNPGMVDSELVTEVPLTFFFDWDILKYKDDFNMSNFGEGVASIYNILLDIAGTSQEEMISEVVDVFMDGFGISGIIEFVEAINETLDEAEKLIVEDEEAPTAEAIRLLSEQSQEKDLDLNTVIFNSFLVDPEGKVDKTLNNLKRLFQRWLGVFNEDLIKDLLIPKFSASITDVNLGLQFPRKWLKPVDEDTNEVIEDESVHSFLKFNVGSLNFSSEDGFSFEGENSLDFTKSQIGDTGFIIGFKGMKLDLSRTSNIPEADIDGRPEDFMGVYAQEVTIGFPKFWGHDDDKSTAELYGENLLIGTGGVSGTIGMRAKEGLGGGEAPLICAKFGEDKGFEVCLEEFEITFQQNTIVGVNIQGELTFPNSFCKGDAKSPEGTATVGIEIDWQDGDWRIVAKPNLVKVGTTGTLADVKSDVTICIPDILNLGIKELAVGTKGDLYYLELSAILDLKFAPNGIGLPSGIHLDKMKIYSDGSYELPKGGYLHFQDPIEIGDGTPMKLSITGLHFGSYKREKGGFERTYKMIGMDGGLKLDPAGVEVRAAGLKVYASDDHWGPDNPRKFDMFIRIESINIDITIPGSDDGELIARIAGFLSMKETKTGATEYVGGIALDLPKVGIAASAGMRFTPSVPNFLIDVALDLSTPIPITPLPLGIYGFRGLFGNKYVATKESAGLSEENTWYDYYKAKVDPTFTEGVNVAKFEGGKGISIGAGLSLATSADTGKTFSMKLMVMLTPGLFYLEGQAALLSERVKLSFPGDPPFSLTLSIDKNAIQSIFGVNFLMPDDGSILKLEALIDKYFPFKNSSGWYINLGTKERKITARILSLFDAEAFLMINSKFIEFGSSLVFKIDKGVKCFGLKGKVYAEKGAKVTFKNFKIGGFMNVGGSFDMEIFCIGLGVSIDMGISISAPKAILLCGFLKATGYVKIPFVGKKSKTLEYEVAWEIGKRDPVPPIDFVTVESGQAINMNTSEGFRIKGIDQGTSSSLPGIAADIDDYIVPMDSYIGFKFNKPVKHGAGSSMNRVSFQSSKGFVEYIPLQKGKEGQDYHEFSVEDVKVYFHNDSEWKEYDIYNALVPIAGENFIPESVASGLKYGVWEKDGEEMTTLTLMATNPFRYVQQGTNPPVIEQMNLTIDELFCDGIRITPFCHTADELSIDELKKNQKQTYLDSGAQVYSETGDIEIDKINTPFDLEEGFLFQKGTDLLVRFPEPANDVRLKLFTRGEVTVRYQSENGLDNWEDVKVETFTGADLFTPVTYFDRHVSIGRILLESNKDCSTAEEQQQEKENLNCAEENTQAQADLLAMLNANAMANTLVMDDANGGLANTLQSTILNNLPAGVSNCELTLNYNPIDVKKWDVTFAVEPIGHFHNYVIEIGSNTFAYAKIPTTVTLGNVGPTEQFINIVVNQINTDAGALVTASKTSPTTIQIEVVDSSVDHFAFTAISPYIDAQVGDVVVATSSIDYNQLTSFQDLTLDFTNAKEGAHFDFKVTAVDGLGAEYALTGKTDVYQLACCEGSFVQLYKDICESVQNQITILETELQELKSQHTEYQMLCTKYQESPCGELANEYCSLVPVVSEKITQKEQEIEQLKTWYETHCNSILSLVCVATNPNGGGGNGIPVLCASALLEVCWLKHVDYVQNVSIPSRDEKVSDVQASIAAIEQAIQPIFRADTVFNVQLRVRDRSGYLRVQDSSPQGLVNNDSFMNFQFKTRGPLGHFHQDASIAIDPELGDAERDALEQTKFISGYKDLLDIEKEDQFKLKGIKHYIDYTKSYPNANGDILNAKPLYYVNPKLYTFYTKNYMPLMFNGFKEYQSKSELGTAENFLDVFITDPAVAPADPSAPGYVEPPRIELYTAFKENRRSMIDKDQLYYIDLLKKNPCLSVLAVAPKGTHHEVSIPVLEPEKLYTAVFNAVYKNNPAQVHSYNFQTSRYSGFEEHVNSYHIVDPKRNSEGYAFFEINLTNEGVSAAQQYDIAKVKQVASNTLPDTDPMVTDFMHPYDRLISGAMKLKSLEDPETTEFNWVRETNPGSADENKIIGLLLRSPEPFCDPKIGADLLKSGIKVLDKDGNVDTDYTTTIVSKDGSKFFITNTNNDIKDYQIKVQFDHIAYTAENGYIVTETVIVDLDVPQYFTKLDEDSCNKVEVGLTDSLTAFPIKNAFGEEAQEYTFHITGGGIDETIVSETRTVDLSSASLDYNKVYTVEVKGKLNEVEFGYGESCNFTTKALNFQFTSTLPDFVYSAANVDVDLALRFNDGTVYTSYNGNVDLSIDANGTITTQTVAFVNGVATATITAGAAGTLAVSLADVDATGYGVSDSQSTAVVEPATQVVVTETKTTFSTFGDTFQVEAQSAAGVRDLGYNGTIVVNLDGTDSTVPIINGIGNASVSSATSDFKTLSFVSSADSLTLPGNQNLLFINPNIDFVKVYAVDTSDQAGNDLTVKVEATLTNGSVDTNFQVDFDMVVTGSATGAGPVSIVNGKGQLDITSPVAESVTVTLNDVNNTGLSLGSEILTFT